MMRKLVLALTSTVLLTGGSLLVWYCEMIRYDRAAKLASAGHAGTLQVQA